ncbi:protein NARROW LEAF 1-like isoform X2 [Rutidosis leptorrhynchoides]|uniref:protein NARROW LEAF 1-like isoform X2 n=1 Tax=Rutidosis leptorrhynchoides TaxID=125765 RepID=UPI003A9A4719
MDLTFHHSGSEESVLDMETTGCNHPPLHSCAATSTGQPSDNNAAYFSWRLNDAAEDRANYFDNLLKGVLPVRIGRLPTGERAVTLLELMTIRAFHSKNLKQVSLATAIGFRMRGGLLTDIPAILVFVARKIHRQWLSHGEVLPIALEGPGGVWCDVDVVEFSYYGAPAATPKEEFYTELVDGLRGSYSSVGSGSQVASQRTYGTLGAIVKSRTGNRQVGFLTNRHVAVDLDYPNQKMFHPMPPSLGPGVYLGAVERATSFITDDLWYDIFAGTNPETFVRADGAFIPFAEDFNVSNNVTTAVRGIGEIGEVKVIDLQSRVNSIVGQRVAKVGRSSGLTTGTIMAYALEYNNDKGICFLTDFLVIGENQKTFDLEGDSGSLIILTGQNDEKPRPIGIIWGGTANRGRLKLKVGQPPENWTSGVDLGRLLDVLELDLITTDEGLQEQRNASSAAAVGINSVIGESSTRECIPAHRTADNHGWPLNLNDQIAPIECDFLQEKFRSESGTEAASNISRFPVNQTGNFENLQTRSLLRNVSEEGLIRLQCGEPEPKRRKQYEENAK